MNQTRSLSLSEFTWCPKLPDFILLFPALLESSEVHTLKGIAEPVCAVAHTPGLGKVYSKTCLKEPLKYRQFNGLNGKW